MKIHNAKIDPAPENEILLITGDGRTLPDDLLGFKYFEVPHDTMAIGRSIQCVDKVKHWANVDGPDSVWWAEHLPPRNDGKMPIRHTLGDCRGYDIDWDDEMGERDRWYGSTALFGVLAGLALGYKKIILAGCPLDTNGHWYFEDSIKGPDWTTEDFMAWEKFISNPEHEKVKSLSGFTMLMLGKPDKEWICTKSSR